MTLQTIAVLNTCFCLWWSGSWTNNSQCSRLEGLPHFSELLIVLYLNVKKHKRGASKLNFLKQFEMVWNGWLNFKIWLCTYAEVGDTYLWGITRIAPIQASLNLLIKSKSAPPMKTNFKVSFTLRRCNYLTIKLWVISPKFWNKQKTKPVKFRSYAHGLKLVRNGNNDKNIKHKTRPV